jgi:diaminohydroxyphosphoribosylaminopyrimidine deaminase / 5-amino-6-(5-phosphoribosylamino)uracil reductase
MADAGSTADRRFMAAAIRLGAGALGTTRPNPAVGAILVKDGKVVGRGRTAPGGRPHGERLALAEAGEAAHGATAFVSLEPCAHHGRTPPCADALVAAGLARVVAPLVDPDPRVGGKGFERLRGAGVEVSTGVLSQEARRVQAGHFCRLGRNRPFVLLKLAVSADDAIGRAGEGPIVVTGDIARRHVQALRSRFDAILVGRGTVDADDPELTCRLPGLEHRSPVRIVLASEGRLAPDRRVFRGEAPTWILNARAEEPAGRHRRLKVPHRAAGGLDLRAALTRLAGEGITRLLVEGGALVSRSLLEADLVDEVMLFRSPLALGGDSVPALAGLPLAEIEASEQFRRMERRMFGPDRMTRYERAR